MYSVVMFLACITLSTVCNHEFIQSFMMTFYVHRIYKIVKYPNVVLTLLKHDFQLSG